MESLPKKFLLLDFFAFIVLLAGSADASIHFYDRDPFREVGNGFLVFGGSEAVLTSRSSSTSSLGSISSVHDATSYIRFENVTFWRSQAAADEHSDMEQFTGLVQVIIFEASDRDNIGGSAYGGQRSICCSPDLAKVEDCKQGEVIRIPSATDLTWPIVLDVNFEGNGLSAEMKDEQVSITKTGMYNLFFISCDQKHKGMTVSGRTLWKNPDGYLPGRMAPLMKFYVILSLAYLLLGIIWLSQYIRFWNDILHLQHCIAVVIGLSLLEVILWWLEYRNLNNTGIRPVAITACVVTVGSIRKTLSRLLILCVSMGFGVVRPTLGGITTKVLLIGLTYFVATELLNVNEYVGTVNDVAGRARVFLVLPNAFLDAFLIMWIFSSLSKTLEQLQAKRSSVKLEIYKKFSNALVGVAVLSVVWIGYEVYFKATDPFNERWESAWVITGFWDILGFGVLCTICYLWAPSQNSQRYAYSEEIGEELDDDGDDEEEAKSLCRGNISLVKQDRKAKAENGDSSDFEDENNQEEGKQE